MKVSAKALSIKKKKIYNAVFCSTSRLHEKNATDMHGALNKKI
jgi:hypothetical protein